jgi:hypothetical protein
MFSFLVGRGMALRVEPSVLVSYNGMHLDPTPELIRKKKDPTVCIHLVTQLSI